MRALLAAALVALSLAGCAELLTLGKCAVRQNTPQRCN